MMRANMLRAANDGRIVIGESPAAEATNTIYFGPATAGDVGILWIAHGASLNAPTGWTKIVTLTRGSVYAKTMAGGETSAVFSTTCAMIGAIFFSGAVAPTTGEGTYSTSGGDPNPPVSVGSASPGDLQLALMAASYSTKSITSALPSDADDGGYVQDAGDDFIIALAWRLVTTAGTVNPEIWDYNFNVGASHGASTIIIAKA